MEKVRIYNYYEFGYNYNNLLRDNSDQSNSALAIRYTEYEKFISKLGLNVTLSSMFQKGLHNDIQKLKNLASTKKTKSAKVKKSLHDSLRRKVKLIDTVLDAELDIKLGYVLDEKRYSNEILTNKISKLFNPGHLDLLPDIAQHDFSESGMCLAFDRYTATAFHSLRATEDTLKWYYSLILGITPKATDTWGTFETAIKKAISNGTLIPAPAEQLIISIESLRKFYRNKTQHPQLIYSSDEAQDLLASCIKTVNEIIRDLKERNLL